LTLAAIETYRVRLPSKSRFSNIKGTRSRTPRGPAERSRNRQGENLRRNLDLLAALEQIAAARNAWR
jgi:hypothetical protein